MPRLYKDVEVISAFININVISSVPGPSASRGFQLAALGTLEYRKFENPVYNF